MRGLNPETSVNLMKKIAMISVMALAVVSASFGQDKAKAPAKTEAPKKLHCAVMAKDEVDIAEATKNKMFADYKGKRYFFCCAGCPESFKKDPAKYAKTAQSIPTPKTETKVKSKKG